MTVFNWTTKMSMLAKFDCLTNLLIVVICLIGSSLCQQNPSISFITKEKVVDIGDTIDLSCSVQYARNYPVIWSKIDPEDSSNTLFISRGSSTSIPDNRYSIRHDDESSTYTLQISKIQEVDAGLYQCQVTIGPSSRVSADVKVSVRIQPVINDNSTRSVITASGMSIQLQCYAFGYPKPDISWRRENDDLLPTGGAVYRGNLLNIHNITKKDRGTYYCVADNRVGRGAKRNVGVEVEFSPEVRPAYERYRQAMNQFTDLKCHVEAFPSANIIWLKNGEQLNDNQYYQVSIFSTNREFTNTVLRIKKIEKQHYGKYLCRAENKLGYQEKAIELEESVNVICPPACGVGYGGVYSGADALVGLPVKMIVGLHILGFLFRNGYTNLTPYFIFTAA